MTRSKRLLATGAVVLVVVFLLSLAFCRRNKKLTTSDDPSVTTLAFQRIEAAMTAIKDGLTRLSSRVETLENKLTPKAGGGGAGSPAVKFLNGKLDKIAVKVEEINRRLKEAGTRLATEETEPVGPLPVTTVDLTPVEKGLRDGLGEIADSIRQSNAETQSAPPIAEPSHQQVPANPCVDWVQDPARYRRCRVWNQLP